MSQIIVIAGATASGKSARALALAEECDAVIINADSQQVYRDFPILTARPSPEDEARVPHRLYGFMSADDNCSAGKWLRLAKMEIDWAISQGKTPIIVGGTGLYLKSLIYGIAEIPDIDNAARAQAESDFEYMEKDAFAARLRDIDPDFFARLKIYDRQRLIRAYAVWLGSGKPLSFWQQQKISPLYQASQFRLEKIELPRAEIYAKCDARVVKMIEQGAIDEVKNIMPQISKACKIIGVQEIAEYLKNQTTLAETIAKIQQKTRNYAKRQITWFKHQL